MSDRMTKEDRAAKYHARWQASQERWLRQHGFEEKGGYWYRGPLRVCLGLDAVSVTLPGHGATAATVKKALPELVQSLRSAKTRLEGFCVALDEVLTGTPTKQPRPPVSRQPGIEQVTKTVHRIADVRRDSARTQELQLRSLTANTVTVEPTVGIEEFFAVEVLVNASVFHVVRVRSLDERRVHQDAAKIALARPIHDAGRVLVLGEITGCTVFDTTGERMNDYNELGE